jgi:hypothetical protein
LHSGPSTRLGSVAEATVVSLCSIGEDWTPQKRLD